MEGDGFLFAGVEVNPLKADEFLVGLLDGADSLVAVELDDFVAGEGAGVGDVYADIDGAIGSGLVGGERKGDFGVVGSCRHIAAEGVGGEARVVE